MSIVWSERMPLHASSTPTSWPRTRIRLPCASAGMARTFINSAAIAATPRMSPWTMSCSRPLGHGTANSRNPTGNAKCRTHGQPPHQAASPRDSAVRIPAWTQKMSRQSGLGTSIRRSGNSKNSAAPASTRRDPDAGRRQPGRTRAGRSVQRRASRARASGGTNQPYWYWSLMVQSTRSWFHRPAQTKSSPPASSHGNRRASSRKRGGAVSAPAGRRAVCVEENLARGGTGRATRREAFYGATKRGARQSSRREAESTMRDGGHPPKFLSS